jgi:hypothetical protein
MRSCWPGAQFERSAAGRQAPHRKHRRSVPRLPVTAGARERHVERLRSRRRQQAGPARAGRAEVRPSRSRNRSAMPAALCSRRPDSLTTDHVAATVRTTNVPTDRGRRQFPRRWGAKRSAGQDSGAKLDTPLPRGRSRNNTWPDAERAEPDQQSQTEASWTKPGPSPAGPDRGELDETSPAGPCEADPDRAQPSPTSRGQANLPNHPAQPAELTVPSPAGPSRTEQGRTWAEPNRARSSQAKLSRGPTKPGRAGPNEPSGTNPAEPNPAGPGRAERFRQGNR